MFWFFFSAHVLACHILYYHNHNFYDISLKKRYKHINTLFAIPK